jgi:hypothetical protein
MGDIVDSGLGCRAGLPAHVAWRPGTNFIPQSEAMNLATGLRLSGQIFFAVTHKVEYAALRWKSQRKKIHRLAFRFSIDFKIYTLAYGFLYVNHKGLAKVYRFLVRAFFSQDFKNP